MRLPANADFDLCEPSLFNGNEKTETVHATFVIRKGLNTSFVQSENPTRTILNRKLVRKPSPTNLLKKEGGSAGFEEASRKLEVSSIKVSIL